MKTIALLAALTALLVIIGNSLGGTQGMWLAVALALTANAYAYLHGPALMIAAHCAVALDRRAARDLIELVEVLAHSAGIPAPKLFVSENPQPNAFSIGRGRGDAMIVLTASLLKILTKNELARVLSHELAHIKSHDTLTMTISVTIVGAVAALIAPLLLIGRITRGGKCFFIILIFSFALLAVTVFQLMISRSREYAADKVGAIIRGHHEWIASALWKLESTKQTENIITRHYLALAHFRIIDPLPTIAWSRLFVTHPPIEHRIARLKQMASFQ